MTVLALDAILAVWYTGKVVSDPSLLNTSNPLQWAQQGRKRKAAALNSDQQASVIKKARVPKGAEAVTSRSLLCGVTIPGFRPVKADKKPVRRKNKAPKVLYGFAKVHYNWNYGPVLDFPPIPDIEEISDVQAVQYCESSEHTCELDGLNCDQLVFHSGVVRH